MRRNAPTVAPDLPLAALVHDYLIPSDNQAFPVVRDGKLIGVVSLSDVRRVLPAQWSRTPVDSVMRADESLALAKPEEPLAEAFESCPARCRPASRSQSRPARGDASSARHRSLARARLGARLDLGAASVKRIVAPSILPPCARCPARDRRRGSRRADEKSCASGNHHFRADRPRGDELPVCHTATRPHRGTHRRAQGGSRRRAAGCTHARPSRQRTTRVNRGLPLRHRDYAEQALRRQQPSGLLDKGDRSGSQAGPRHRSPRIARMRRPLLASARCPPTAESWRARASEPGVLRSGGPSSR